MSHTYFRKHIERHIYKVTTWHQHPCWCHLVLQRVAATFVFFFMKIISTGQGQTPPFGAQWQWCCAMRPSAPAVAAQSWGRRRMSDGARGCLPAGSTHTCPRSSSCSVVTASLTKFLKCQCPGHWHTSMFTLWSSLCEFENRGPRERAAKHQTHKEL